MLGETLLFVPLSPLPPTDADRNEGEAAMREAETVRNPAHRPPQESLPDRTFQTTRKKWQGTIFPLNPSSLRRFQQPQVATEQLLIVILTIVLCRSKKPPTS